MPQLDFIIIFPQVFWLCTIFSLFYFILTFYLLPKFITSFKIRKSILEESSRRVSSEMQTLAGKNYAQNHLLSFFEKLQTNYKNLDLLLKTDFSSSSSILDKKIVNATRLTILFCDPLVIKSIPFFPKIFKK